MAYTRYPTDYGYFECSVCFADNAAFYVLVEDSGGGEQYTFFDHLERPVGSDTALLGGARSREEVRYLATGQVEQTSLPYVAGDAVFWVSYEYDGIGRLIEEDAPVSESQGSGAITAYEYLGHTLEVTDAKNHTTAYLHNALGQIERVTDALGGETNYSYHPFGELHEVTDNASNTTELLYDARGYKQQMDEPEMGVWEYDYNAFGELIWQKDAKAQEVDLGYDAAGRLVSRDDDGEVTTWTYYTTGTGQKGRLQTVAISASGLEEAYVYSGTHGALTQVTRSIGSQDYTFDFDFDSHGRLIEMTYPENVHQTRFAVEYQFDSWGALSQVNDAATPSLVYYSLDTQDALGRATEATLGNGLVEQLGYSKATGRLVSIQTGPNQTATLQDLAYDWDMAGNLTNRDDDVLAQEDVFSYDALDRLEDQVRNSSTIFSVTYDTSHLGNIKTKTGVTGTYTYGAGSAGPHAVTGIGSMTFGYDANGNMTNRNGASIGWTSFNKPDHIAPPETGEIVWYYQHIVDHWDLDHPFERLLVDTAVAPDPDSVRWINPRVRPGERRRVVTGIPGKTGVVYTLDRATGEFLWAKPTVEQNVLLDLDRLTGEPVVNPETTFVEIGQERFVCPTALGGKNWPSGTYSPRNNVMYFPLQNTCMTVAPTLNRPSPDSLYGIRSSARIAPGADGVGSIHAISVETGRTLWTYDQRAGVLSLMSTAGGLVFGGDANGRFRALDQDTGDVLWEINLGSPVSGYPVSFAVNGRQYVAVSTGSSLTAMGANALTPELRPSSGNNLFVFALPE